MKEWLGGNTTVVETNYFGKGNTTTYDRAIYYTVDDPQDNWHTYTIDWTSEYIKWYVDGTLVRTLLYADALDGYNFPQTPMLIKLGIWDGGAADESTGTVDSSCM
jgi:beta-glucanase (GH16 family)